MSSSESAKTGETSCNTSCASAQLLSASNDVAAQAINIMKSTYDPDVLFDIIDGTGMFSITKPRQSPADAISVRLQIFRDAKTEIKKELGRADLRLFYILMCKHRGKEIPNGEEELARYEVKWAETLMTIHRKYCEFLEKEADIICPNRTRDEELDTEDDEEIDLPLFDDEYADDNPHGEMQSTGQSDGTGSTHTECTHTQCEPCVHTHSSVENH